MASNNLVPQLLVKVRSLEAVGIEDDLMAATGNGFGFGGQE